MNARRACSISLTVGVLCVPAAVELDAQQSAQGAGATLTASVTILPAIDGAAFATGGGTPPVLTRTVTRLVSTVDAPAPDVADRAGSTPRQPPVARTVSRFSDGERSRIRYEVAVLY